MKYQLHEDYQQLSPLIENIEAAFQQSTRILHAERNEIRLVSFDDTDYVVKSFKVPNAVNRFAYRYLRASKAQRSYDYSRRLGADVCPEAVAYIEQYKNTLLTKSYFISRHFAYDYSIRPVILEKDFEQRTAILQEFVEFTHQLHQQNILHRDYSPGNILLKKQTDGRHLFKIIDVNRMQFKTLSLKERLYSFARLMVDNDTMKILIDHYSPLIQKPKDELLDIAIGYRESLISKKALKNKLRGRG